MFTYARKRGRMNLLELFVAYRQYLKLGQIESFEPKLMSNSPPMAEQFLRDLGRMIAISKKRRVMPRRHVCRLGIIREETEDELRMAATLTGLQCFSDKEEAEGGSSGDVANDENPTPSSSTSLDEKCEAMKEAGELKTGESDSNIAPHTESSATVYEFPISKFPKSPRLAIAVDPTSKCGIPISTDATPITIRNGAVGA